MTTQEKIDKVLSDLVKGGKITAQEGEKIIKKIWKDTEDERAAIKKGFKKTVKRIEKRIDIPTREEFESLKKRVSAIEKRIGK